SCAWSSTPTAMLRKAPGNETKRAWFARERSPSPDINPRRSDGSMPQSDSMASASPFERSEAVFDSIKNWLNRTDQHQADKQNLEGEAKQFKLPGENLPAAIKVAVFIGLAALNVRLFLQLVSGPLGYAISSLAVASEALALYSFHNFSRTAGAFRWVL